MITRCKKCKSTNVQCLEWIYPNTETRGHWPHTVEIPSGDPYSSNDCADHNWCERCDSHCELETVNEEPEPEIHLDALDPNYEPRQRPVQRLLDSLEAGGYWNEQCENCGETFAAPNGEDLCPTCRAMSYTERHCKHCGRSFSSVPGDYCPSCAEGYSVVGAGGGDGRSDAPYGQGGGGD
jgi:hypothetical protein